MKNIKKATAALELKLKELSDNQDQIERARIVISTVSQGDGQLAKLRQQRSEEIGTAFIESRPAQTESIDASIEQVEKEMAGIHANRLAAQSALHLLKIKDEQLEQDVSALREAQDAAINVFSALKDKEALDLLESALLEVNKAFKLMAAAYQINRQPLVPGVSGSPCLFRLDRLVEAKFNVDWRSTEEFDKLKMTLEEIGVTDVGIKRQKQEVRQAEVPTINRPASISFVDPVAARNHPGSHLVGPRSVCG